TPRTRAAAAARAGRPSVPGCRPRHRGRRVVEERVLRRAGGAVRRAGAARRAPGAVRGLRGVAALVAAGRAAPARARALAQGARRDAGSAGAAYRPAASPRCEHARRVAADADRWVAVL